MLNGWQSVMLAHLVRCAPVIEKALNKLTTVSVIKATDNQDAGYIWTCSKEYYQKYSKPIPRQFLEAKLVERIEINKPGDLGLYDDDNASDAFAQDAEKLEELVNWIYSIDEKDFEVSEAINYVQEAIDKGGVMVKLGEMIEEGASARDILQEVQTAVSSSTIGSLTLLDPLAGWTGWLKDAAPTPIGSNDIEYFNRLCQGGPKPGEVIVLIGPQGGYKTTMMIDVTSSMAKVEEHSLFLTYEMTGAGTDMRIRFLSRLTGISRNRLESLDFVDTVTEEEQALIADALNYSSKYTHWADRTSSGDRVDAIAGVVKECSETTGKPELVVIDQAMPLIQQWKNFDGKDARVPLGTLIMEAKRKVAEPFQTRVVILHQLAGEHLGKEGKKMAPNSAAESKGIGNWCDFLIMMGVEEKNSHCFWATTGKTRRGKHTEILLRGVGEFSRLCPAADMVEHPRKKGMFIKAGTEHLIPSASGSENTTTTSFGPSKPKFAKPQH